MCSLVFEPEVVTPSILGRREYIASAPSICDLVTRAKTGSSIMVLTFSTDSIVHNMNSPTHDPLT
jgi:hypothetical protein